jgi:tripartite-type tricarboxylate transporter receptor subunit TctC
MLKNPIRRSFLLLAMLAAAGVSAQTYPTKPIKIIVPFSAGGSVDMVARLVGKRLSETLGQPFIIDNRAGASGNIGADFVAKSAPDGYTLLVTGPGVLVANSHLYKKLPFDPAKDFSPVIRLVNQPNILMVHPSVQASNVKEFIALAKARPGKVSVGSAGIGTGQDIAAQQFALMTGADILNVPYKGGAPALSDLLGGQIDAMFETAPTAMPYVKQGKLKGLAITSAKRSSLLPDLPTVSEAGVSGYESVTWIGMLAPAGTPKAIVDQLNSEIQKVLGGEVGKQLAEMSLDPIGGTPKDYSDAIRKDAAVYAKIIKAANIQPQ